MTHKHHVGENQEHAASSRFAYDKLGRLTLASNAWSEVKFAYDPLGQLLAETQSLCDKLGAKKFEFKHQYDPLGNRIQTILPGGQQLNHLFYGSGHLHQVNLDGQVVSNFERDALHREVRRSQGQLHSEFAYDRAGRLSAQRVLRTSEAGSSETPLKLFSPEFPTPSSVRSLEEIQDKFKGVIERHYKYDPSGQLVQWLDRHRGLTRYAYDAAGRITHSQIGLLKDWGAVGVPANAPGNTTGRPMAANERFHWDPASNPLPDEAAVTRRDFVPGNRLLIWQDARYTYDDHGNLIERLQGKRGSAAQTRTLFTWDAAHQLVCADVARGPDKTAVTQTYTYAYDALGRRIAKLDAVNPVIFGWDGDRMSIELCWERNLIYFYHPESFSPLAQFNGDVLQHLHSDHLGTPLEASNDAGELTWRATYKTWGNTLISDTSDVYQRLIFQGQYFDAESGLHYNRFRYFDPMLGRFISNDPIGLAGGTNSFQYAPNPIYWIDPWGLAKRGPKAKGCGPHNAMIEAWGREVVAKGGTVLAGGGLKPEIFIPTPGGVKGGRRPDIIFRDADGKTIYGNVGKQDAQGAPIKREAAAKSDLENKTQGKDKPDEVQFRAYNCPCAKPPNNDC